MTMLDLDGAAAITDWLDDRWDPSLSVGEWWQRLADAGLSMPELPPPWGRGWTRAQIDELLQAMTVRGALFGPGGMGSSLVAPTLVEHGSEALQRAFLPGILNGQDGWCQLFSEPGAGSDLAGLQTRAVRDGDEWVVNGQKVWTSTGQWADYAILVARTNPDVAKHAGLSFFLIDMHQPGIEVRPLREMTGEAMFNEVFLDDARVPHAWMVGHEGDGWLITNTTLRVERAGIGGGGSRRASAIPGSVAGHVERRAGEAVADRPDAGPTRVTFELLRDLAEERGLLEDPLVRQQFAQLYTLNRVSEWHLARMRAGATSTGVDGNLAKVRGSQVLLAARALGEAILGVDAVITGPTSASGDAVQRHILFSPGPQIYGGSDQIQRNIIGERGLALPKEPDPNKGRPFSELPSNATPSREGSRP